jgi:CBS domain-containing membrane protein
MSSPAIGVSPEVTLGEAHAKLRAHHIQHLCVLRDGALVGILSERDLLRAMPSALSSSEAEYAAALETVRVEQVMSRIVTSVGPEFALSDAIGKLTSSRFHALPVVDAGRVVGMLTVTDCLTLLNRRD